MTTATVTITPTEAEREIFNKIVNKNQPPANQANLAWIQEAEDYANGRTNSHKREPRAIKPPLNNSSSPSSLLSAYVELQRLSPTSFVARYVNASKEEREKTQELALRVKNLQKARYTPKDVAEMLRIFNLLDRLTDPERDLKAARERENQAYHLDLSQAHQVKLQMSMASKEMEERQKSYGLWMKRLGFRNRTKPEPVQTHTTQTIDYLRLEKYLSEQFEKALALRKQQHQRDMPEQLESNPLNKLTDPKELAKTLEKFRAKNTGGNIVGLTRKVREQIRDQFPNANTPFSKFKHLRTGEAYRPFGERPSQLFGKTTVKNVREMG